VGAAVASLKGLLLLKMEPKAIKKKPASVFISDVTDNLSSFEELFHCNVAVTHIRSTKTWMDPSKHWEQSEGLQRVGKQQKEKLVALTRESYLSYPYIVFSQEDRSPRSGNPTGAEDNEVIIKHKKKT